MNLPQLPREPIRPELEGNQADKELWQPRWRCFCCEDAGLVRVWLVELLIPDYDHHRDKSVLCQNPRCEASEKYRGSNQYDQRFTAGICAELDKRNRDNWRRTTESHFQRIQNRIKEAAKEKSLRARDRTPEEDQLVAERHRLTTEEDWGLSAQTPTEKKWMRLLEEEG